MPTRRAFCLSAASTLIALPIHAQAGQGSPQLGARSSGPTRLNLAQIDHDRILAAANTALTRPPTTGSHLGAQPSDAFLHLTLDIPALAAANLIAPGPAYTPHALTLLTAWFVDRATAMDNEPDAVETVLQTASLAELVVALPFLEFDPVDLARVSRWFEHYLTWLTTDRTALLARDSKDRTASSWLLQVAALARLLKQDQLQSELLHRFKTQTLRAQINANGFFPHELTTPNPFRNSLFNLDLLAGVCVLLSTRFDSLWDYELQDGPGMRAAIARHAPYIAAPRTWPYPVDATLFRELPGRRPALLFAARAYAEAEYAALWQTLRPDPVSPELLRAFPIRQPILWQPSPHPSMGRSPHTPPSSF